MTVFSPPWTKKKHIEGNMWPIQLRESNLIIITMYLLQMHVLFLRQRDGIFREQAAKQYPHFPC